MDLTRNIGNALRLARQHKGLPREDFATVSSANYLGEVERGTKRVTVEKLGQLAEVLDVHPASLVLYACLQSSPVEEDLESVLKTIRAEVTELMAVQRLRGR